MAVSFPKSGGDNLYIENVPQPPTIGLCHIGKARGWLEIAHHLLLSVGIMSHSSCPVKGFQCGFVSL